jgi:hypothetical protein
MASVFVSDNGYMSVIIEAIEALVDRGNALADFALRNLVQRTLLMRRVSHCGVDFMNKIVPKTLADCRGLVDPLLHACPTAAHGCAQAADGFRAMNLVRMKGQNKMVDENDILKFSPEMQADIRSEILDYQKKGYDLEEIALLSNGHVCPDYDAIETKALREALRKHGRKWD